jgi:uncharacterized protein YcsI (UPF0317 family)
VGERNPFDAAEGVVGDDEERPGFRDSFQIGIGDLHVIADLAKPDYGDAVPIKDDEIPVFWACGVTPQSVVQTVKPEFCITHYPGSMLVTDRRNSEFAIM